MKYTARHAWALAAGLLLSGMDQSAAAPETLSADPALSGAAKAHWGEEAPSSLSVGPGLSGNGDLPGFECVHEGPWNGGHYRRTTCPGRAGRYLADRVREREEERKSPVLSPQVEALIYLTRTLESTGDWAKAFRTILMSLPCLGRESGQHNKVPGPFAAGCGSPYDLMVMRQEAALILSRQGEWKLAAGQATLLLDSISAKTDAPDYIKGILVDAHILRALADLEGGGPMERIESDLQSARDIGRGESIETADVTAWYFYRTGHYKEAWEWSEKVRTYSGADEYPELLSHRMRIAKAAGKNAEFHAARKTLIERLGELNRDQGRLYPWQQRMLDAAQTGVDNSSLQPAPRQAVTP